MASDPIISWQIDGEKMAIVRDFVRQSHWKWWLQAWNRKMLALGRKAVTNLNSILKSRDITLPTKSIYSNLCCFFFFNSHVWMWELDYKESWTPKNWCLWIMVLKKTPGSPLDFKLIQPVRPKENQSWIFIRRTDVEAETPILRPPEAKNWFIWKSPWCWKRLKAGGEGDETR